MANYITASRILLIFPVLYLISDQNDNRNWIALALFITAGLTDHLDGYVARKMNQISNLGKLLDPIADKICLVIVMVFLIFDQGLPFLLFFLLLSIRDVYIIIIGLYLIHVQNIVFQANKSGKYFMAVTTLMMASFVFRDTFNLSINVCWLLYVISLIFMVISGYEYHYRYIKYFNRISSEDKEV